MMFLGTRRPTAGHSGSLKEIKGEKCCRVVGEGGAPYLDYATFRKSNTEEDKFELKGILHTGGTRSGLYGKAKPAAPRMYDYDRQLITKVRASDRFCG